MVHVRGNVKEGALTCAVSSPPRRRRLSSPLSSPSCRILKFLCLLWSKRTLAKNWTASRNSSLGRCTWIRRSEFAVMMGNLHLHETVKLFLWCVFKIEKFLRASREVDVSLHVPARRCLEEPLEGLPEGFRGNPQRGRIGLGWSLCDWTCTASMQQLRYKFVRFSLIQQLFFYSVSFLLGYSAGAPREGVWG